MEVVGVEGWTLMTTELNFDKHSSQEVCKLLCLRSELFRFCWHPSRPVSWSADVAGMSGISGNLLNPIMFDRQACPKEGKNLFSPPMEMIPVGYASFLRLG